MYSIQSSECAVAYVTTSKHCCKREFHLRVSLPSAQLWELSDFVARRNIKLVHAAALSLKLQFCPQGLQIKWSDAMRAKSAKPLN